MMRLYLNSHSSIININYWAIKGYCSIKPFEAIIILNTIKHQKWAKKPDSSSDQSCSWSSALWPRSFSTFTSKWRAHRMLWLQTVSTHRLKKGRNGVSGDRNNKHVDHVGVYLHASNESYHTAPDDGQDLLNSLSIPYLQWTYIIKVVTPEKNRFFGL